MSTAFVSLMQINSDDSESPVNRFERVIKDLSEIAQGKDGRKPDLIMLPELWHGGAFNIDLSVSLATTFQDQFLSKFVTLRLQMRFGFMQDHLWKK